MCSLCVLVQSESRAIEQLSYILETREERTFDNIFDVKIFSFQFDQYPLAEQFTGMNTRPTFVVAFECSFVCIIDLQCNCFSGTISMQLLQCNCLSSNAGVNFCYRCNGLLLKFRPNKFLWSRVVWEISVPLSILYIQSFCAPSNLANTPISFIVLIDTIAVRKASVVDSTTKRISWDVGTLLHVKTVVLSYPARVRFFEHFFLFSDY